MSYFDFQILPKEDLLSPQSSYYVKNVLEIDKIPLALQEIKMDFNTDGAEHIILHFSNYFSIIYHGTKVPKKQVTTAFEFIRKSFQILTRNLSVTLDDESELDQELSKKLCNILKMTMYVLLELLKIINQFQNQDFDDSNLLKKKDRRKKDEDTSDEYNPLYESHEVLVLIYGCFQKPLHKLWNPPIVDNDLIEFIVNFCYDTLAIPAIKNKKDISTTIFEILGTSVKTYRYRLPSTYFLRLIQSHQHLNQIISNGVVMLTQEYNCKTLIKELLHDLIEWQVKDDSIKATELKQCSLFLIELAKLVPNAMISEMVYLEEKIFTDVYQVRITIFTIMSEVILILANEELNDEGKEQRNSLLNVLEEGFYDVNAFCRSKIIQLWSRLQENGAIPLQKLNGILKKIIERLKDKAINVRKNSIAGVKTFIEYNPFTAKFNFNEMKVTYEANQAKINEIESKLTEVEVKWLSIMITLQDFIEQKLLKIPNLDLTNLQSIENFPIDDFKYFLLENNFDRAFEIINDHYHFIKTDCSPEKDDSKINEENQAGEIFTIITGLLFSNEINQEKLDVLKTSKTELEKLEKIGEFLKISIQFSDLITMASNQIETLFLSKANTEAIEAIEYFVSVHNFIPDGNISCIINMLDLLFLDEKDRSNAVISAFNNMFFKSDTKSKRVRAFHIYKNLKNILQSINYNQYEAFKILINICVHEKVIDVEEIQLLWEIVAKKINEFSESDIKIALNILCIIAQSKVEIVVGNLPILESLIEQYGKNDYQIVQFICYMLIQLEEIHAGKQDRSPFKYTEDHSLIHSLIEMLRYGSKNLNKNYTPMAKEIIKVIYAICDKPSTICSQYLKEFYRTIVKEDNFDESKLIHFLQIVGTAAISELIYLDEKVYKELKRRTHLKNLVKNKKTKPFDSVSTISSANASRSNRSRTDKDENAPLEGAEAANFEAEFILNVLDTSILKPKNFFGSILKMLQSICHNIKQYGHNPKLQISATTCFNQLLTFSSKYVEKNAALMFTLIEKVENIKMKKNIMVALLDFSVHYASVMHPWMNYIYLRLHDESAEIRKATLFILSHLIHNDMVLVKGHIGEVALCIIDKEETVRQKAKLLFSHLAAKPNALYNVMPDVIGRLTSASANISDDNFQTIMKFLFNLIQKEKQMENLIEKLCSRLQVSSSQRELEDLSYCLYIAKYNVRSLQLLLDALPSLKDQLLDHNVYNYIKQIAATYMKNAKPEIRDVAAELHSKIEKFSGTEWNENAENMETAENEPCENEKTPTKKSNQSLNVSEAASTRKSVRKQPARKKLRK